MVHRDTRNILKNSGERIPLASEVRLTPIFLGEGSNSQVVVGDKRGKKVAVKLIDKSVLRVPAQRDELKNELSVLRTISGKHTNIAPLLSYSEDDDNFRLVFELYPLSLFELCSDLGRLYEEEARPLFAQLVDAVSFLHNYNTENFEGICHRDLKLENIMLSADKSKLFLIDFGFATFIRPGEKLTKQCGSFHYVAPEIVLKQNYDGKSVDCWALGCILYSLLNGRQPFYAEDPAQLFRLIVSGEFDHFTEDLGEEAKELIQGLLQVDPSKRWDINRVKSHPWVRSSSPLVGL